MLHVGRHDDGCLYRLADSKAKHDGVHCPVSGDAGGADEATPEKVGLKPDAPAGTGLKVAGKGLKSKPKVVKSKPAPKPKADGPIALDDDGSDYGLEVLGVNHWRWLGTIDAEKPMSDAYVRVIRATKSARGEAVLHGLISVHQELTDVTALTAGQQARITVELADEDGNFSA